MRYLLALVVLCSALFSGNLFAQVVPGWGVGWGAASVPLSPWLIALISVTLSVIAFYVLRRGNSRFAGAAALLIGCLVSAGALNVDKIAFAGMFALDIQTATGSQTLICTGPFPIVIGTTLAGGATISRLTPVNGAPPLSGEPGECSVGLKLAQGEGCSLPCTIGEEPE